MMIVTTANGVSEPQNAPSPDAEKNIFSDRTPDDERRQQ